MAYTPQRLSTRRYALRIGHDVARHCGGFLADFRGMRVADILSEAERDPMAVILWGLYPPEVLSEVI